MNDVETWIATYMKEKGKLNGDEGEAVLEANYFERKLLDSLAIVEMVLGIEDEFGVRLESDHMQDPRFCTIRGLSQIVDELRAAA